MKGIGELVTSKALAAYWEIVKNQRAPYFGESKFPSKKKLGLDLSWIKGARKAPVMLSLSAFDAKAIPLNRGTIDKLSTDMPFFKNSKNIDEKQRQELNKLIGNSNGNAAVKIILNDIFNDKLTLLEDALMTLEVMRMQALTTGALSLSGNGQSYSYDYGVPANHKVSPSIKWDAEGADPIADIESWCDAIENETGVRPTEGVMNSVTLSILQKCDAIKNAICVFGNGKVTPSKKDVLKYLQSETGVTFYIVSKTYNNAAGVSTKYVADGTVVLMPASPLGNTWFGTTPEESDLMAASNAEVSIVEQGIAITTTKETDPVNVMTKVTMIALPSFELADQIIIASVKTA